MSWVQANCSDELQNQLERDKYSCAPHMKFDQSEQLFLRPKKVTVYTGNVCHHVEKVEITQNSKTEKALVKREIVKQHDSFHGMPGLADGLSIQIEFEDDFQEDRILRICMQKEYTSIFQWLKVCHGDTFCENECPICLEALDKNARGWGTQKVVRRDCCGRVFHSGCLDEAWRAGTKTCPCCRSNYAATSTWDAHNSCKPAPDKAKGEYRFEQESDEYQMDRQMLLGVYTSGI